MEETLINGIRALNIPMSPAQVTLFLTYVRMMARWNQTYNLTAIRDPERMLTEHVLDSLAILPHLYDVKTILDVGTGAGLPGIPLAIARPDLHVVLLDSNNKKTAFVTQMKIELGLKQVEVESKRVERFHPKKPFDRIVTRAFSSLSEMVGLTRPLLAPDGLWLAMKGVYPQDEIDALPEDIRVTRVDPIIVPGLDAQRHLVSMAKLSPEEVAAKKEQSATKISDNPVKEEPSER